MKFARAVFDFWGMMCVLLCAAGGFYFVSNDYFIINGKMMDFSLYGWAALIVLWAVGLWRYCRNKPLLLWFAIAVSVVAGSFDCHRFVMYAVSVEHLWCIRILICVEAVLLLGLVILKKCGCVGRGGVSLAAAAVLLTYFGTVLMYPQICPLEYIYGVAGGYAVLWGIFNGVSAKKADLIAAAGVGSLFLLMCGLGGLFYSRLPGIRFYEAKVTEPAKEVKVSIVIPVYNAEEVIKRCLDSLRRQTLKEIEIIAVDDGSTDKTPEILAEYAAHDVRIRVIRQENAYVGAARNRGIRAAKGEYVGLVDNDDWVSEDYYQALYEAAKKQNQNVAMTRNVQEAWQKATFLQKIQGKNIEFADDIKDKILKLNRAYSGFVWTKIYKRDFLLDNEIFFMTYRTVYEDSYFSILLLTYLDDMAFAEKGTYYHTVKERKTFSFTRAKLEDEIFEMHRLLENDLMAAKVDEAHRQKGMELFNIFRKNQLRNFYSSLEDKAKFYERCAAVLAADVCSAAMRDNVKEHDLTADELAESMRSR